MAVAIKYIYTNIKYVSRLLNYTLKNIYAQVIRWIVCEM